ncbi:MAG TPA: transglycosylase [Nitrospirae bacterium]|nr:membrane-bound lytic murein transglycosylase A precursor [bacterium BMS3Abin06]HDH13494.1 transglycosylase [Nitrospirota bacterium]HDZ01066.1 transglycosylase [Nitrospirota bacterium]
MKINPFFECLVKCLVSLCLFFVLATCTLFVKPPAEPGLEQMSIKKVKHHDWEDDLSFKGLEAAVEQSIRYYEKLPPGKTFQYNGLNYSPEEMLASLKLFTKIIKNSGSKEPIQQLREKFLFFESRNREGEAFFTGYYEPLVEGSLSPTEKFTVPVYRTPGDLIEVDLGQFAGKWKNEKIVGRLKGGQLVPYDSREEIVYEQSLEGRAEAIAYVNEIELFFLQIQGSGLVRLPDGKVKRINYDEKNGHPYRSIGKILKERIAPDEVSLQSIKAYLYENPDEVREILTHNQSYVFFREVEEGPLGYIEVPLTPNRSIAMDRKVIPRGGLAFIETDIPVFKNRKVTGWKPLKRFVLVQDTGGAIRGHGRVDIFFGHEENAELLAGHLKQRGRVFLIVARKEFL